MKSRSRGAPWRPSYATSLLEIVTTGHSRSQNGVLRTPMPVVHAAVPQANARWKALFQRDFGMDCRIRSGNDEREERKKKYRRRNADRRKALLPCLTGTAAPGAPGAHLSAFHRGSRPKESFIARDSAPGFCFLGRGLSVEWALPTPAYPSPAKSSRPGRSAEGLMPNAARERVASPRAGAALAPDLRPAGRSPSDRARSEQCNLFSDICQAASLSQ
jgi:hypothetical protein